MNGVPEKPQAHQSLNRVEPMGYPPIRFEHPSMLSATCTETVSVLAISSISPDSTFSSVSAVWVKFRAKTDTKAELLCRGPALESRRALWTASLAHILFTDVNLCVSPTDLINSFKVLGNDYLCR